MNNIVFTLPCDKDKIDFDNKMRIDYYPRKNLKLHDVWVTYPNPKDDPPWFLWERQ